MSKNAILTIDLLLAKNSNRVTPDNIDRRLPVHFSRQKNQHKFITAPLHISARPPRWHLFVRTGCKTIFVMSPISSTYRALTEEIQRPNVQNELQSNVSSDRSLNFQKFSIAQYSIRYVSYFIISGYQMNIRHEHLETVKIPLSIVVTKLHHFFPLVKIFLAVLRSWN